MSDKLKFLLVGVFFTVFSVLIVYLFYQDSLQDLLGPKNDSGSAPEVFKLVRMNESGEPGAEYSYVQRGYLVSTTEDKLYVRTPETTEEFKVSDDVYMFCLPSELGGGQPLASVWVDPDELFSVHGTKKMEGTHTDLTEGTFLLMYISEDLHVTRIGVVECASQ